MQARNFKQWILKTTLSRHYYSIKGLGKAILNDFQHNVGNLQCHTHPYPTSRSNCHLHWCFLFVGVVYSQLDKLSHQYMIRQAH